MACPLTNGALYKNPPARDIFRQEDAQKIDFRCMEQTCFSVGSCLLQPCESLRPLPSLPSSFDLLANSKQAQDDVLLCSYLNLQDYKLYYDSDPKSQNCWESLASKKELARETRAALRVWEQIGFSQADKMTTILEDYNKAYKSIIESSS